MERLNFDIESDYAVKEMRRKSPRLSYGAIASVLVMGMSLATFAIILIKNYSTDLDGHIHLLELHLYHGKFPVPPLYYSSLYLLKQIFSTNYKINTVLILSLSVLWKYKLSLKYIGNHTPLPKSDLVVALALGGLMFFFPVYLPGIDGSKLYLGKFTPTIWHNSTSIFAFPFSLLLFFRSIKYIERPNGKDLMQLFLLSVLILMSKPSFLFAFVPVFPFIYIIRNRALDVGFVKIFGFCLFVISAIVFMGWWIYENGQIDNLLYGGEKTEVFLAPFEVWLNWTNVPFIDSISSLLFLLAFVGVNHETLLKDWHFAYSSLLLIAGMLIFWLFAESGERFAHGNFYWQVPICMFIVYLVLIKHWIAKTELNASLIETVKGLGRADKILLGLFSLHVFSGGIYLFKLLYFGSFS